MNEFTGPDEDTGGPDPLAQAFANHVRAPADIVPRTPLPVDDLHALAGQTVELVHHDIDPESGITTHTERITITAPILPKGHPA
ncbi:hypothetical protein [Mycolicibacterium gilvum]|uniref:hypothetical protein n=1 Tax=Mycolicibacterium gilvum TaxID=1804 RepID=UPI004045B8F4